jgi:polyisoprenoid-binding protein YceI
MTVGSRFYASGLTTALQDGGLRGYSKTFRDLTERKRLEDGASHPTITFQSTKAERVGASDYEVTGDLAIRGVTRPATLDLRYLGRWRTPYNEARVTRVGFTGGTRINRHDFGVSWNASMENAGLVVGSEVIITVDVEAILDTDLRPIVDRNAVP